jgi:hypothetical protein
MKGVILVCLFYGSLPFLVLALCSLLTSGFPVFPLITGLALLIAFCRDSSQRGSHFPR